MRCLICCGMLGLLGLWSATACGEELPAGAVVRIGGGEHQPDSIRVLALSSDAGLLAVAGEPEDPTKRDRTIQLWNARTGELVRTLEGHPLPIRALAFTSQNQILISTAENAAGDGQTILWNVGSGQRLATLPAAGAAIEPTEGSRFHLAVPAQYQVLTYDTATKQEVQRSPRVRFPVAVSPRGRYALSLISQRDARFWLMDLRTGNALRRFEGNSGRPPDAALVISPDERTLAASDGGNSILVWELATGQRVHQLTGHEGKVSALLFTGDSRYLISAGFDQTVRVWEVATGKLCATFAGHGGPITRLALSGDQSTLASGGIDRTAILWDLKPTRRTFLPAEELADQQLEELWRQLALVDATQAYQTIGLVRLHPERTLPYLKKTVHSILVPEQNARIQELIGQLEDPDYVIRQRATVELRKLRAVALPILLNTIAQTRSDEVRYRVRRILQGSKNRPRFEADDIRRIERLIHTLQHTPGPEARDILDLIIQHFPEKAVVEQARDLQQRLVK